MTPSRVRELVKDAQLEVFGVVREDALPDGANSLILLGPREPGFWDHVQSAPEFDDGKPDPIDRWSRRVIGALAKQMGGEALFPFGGPPYHPFIRWAQDSGRCWQSPVGLLVHDVAGLMVSFRGAIALPFSFSNEKTANPCESCASRPCLTACPVGALGPDQTYDVPRCKAHVLSEEGAPCRDGGCLVRRACPTSLTYGRLKAQSAHHMRYFAQ